MIKKPNYQVVLDLELEKIKADRKIFSLVLHTCCGPCSTYVIKYLANYFDLYIYYYNPNISTKEEFDKRLKQVRKVIENIQSNNRLELIVEDYNHDEFLSNLNDKDKNEKEGGSRCIKCYHNRLEQSFIYAKKKNIDYVTTTLTISPNKNAFIINNLGKSLEHKHQVKYLKSDFKKNNGYKESIVISRELDLYRQDFCGCEFSLENREG